MQCSKTVRFKAATLVGLANAQRDGAVVRGVGAGAGVGDRSVVGIKERKLVSREYPHVRMAAWSRISCRPLPSPAAAPGSFS
jgi:hypothetical protein